MPPRSPENRPPSLLPRRGCIKIIDDPVVEAVELGSPLVGDCGIGADRAEETRSQRGVDSFEQLQEQQALSDRKP